MIMEVGSDHNNPMDMEQISDEVVETSDKENISSELALNGTEISAKCDNGYSSMQAENGLLKTEICPDFEAENSPTGKQSNQLEDLWQIFFEFEVYSYDSTEVSFTSFLTEWQSRLNRAVKCGLQYDETILCLKLIRSCNLDPVTRSNIFSAVNSHIETNLLLFTLSALNNIKDEDKENQIKVEDSEMKKVTPKYALAVAKDFCENEICQDLDPPSENENTKLLFECSQCPKSFQRAQEYQKHVTGHNVPQNGHACPVCLTSFTKKSMLDDHLQSHAENAKFKCTACDKHFFSEKTLKHHMKNVHKKHLSCEHCDKMFGRQSKLTKHMETHAKRLAASEGYFQCDQCGKEMQGKKRLRIHKRTHFQFRCQPCNKIFKDQDLLNRHVLNHKEYGCTQCGQVFFQKALLIKHKNTVTHGGERKFACDLCGRTFMKKYNLQVHQLTHTGEKNFKCEYQDCTMAFYKKDVMIRHMRIHTGERPYQCDICERRFTQSGDLRKHRRTHGVE